MFVYLNDQKVLIFNTEYNVLHYNVKMSKAKLRTNKVYNTESTILIHFVLKKKINSIYLSSDRISGGTSSSFLSNSFSLRVCSSTSSWFSFSSCLSLCKGREDKTERKPIILGTAYHSSILL